MQRRYLYLENIFTGEDIRKQLPNEVKIFDDLATDWANVTTKLILFKIIYNLYAAISSSSIIKLSLSR